VHAPVAPLRLLTLVVAVEASRAPLETLPRLLDLEGGAAPRCGIGNGCVDIDKLGVMK